MRLVGIALVVVLATSTAYANPLPFEIVRVLPETNQVLVYSRAQNTHVLLHPGSTFDDYVIVEISGIEVIVEKQQQRFAVYPRKARHLALSVLPRDKNAPAQPPVIFSKSVPAPVPPQAVATSKVDAKAGDPKKQVAHELALVLAQSPIRATPRPPAPALTTTLQSAKLKP